MLERERHRSGGLQALAASITAVTAPVLARHGEAFGRIVADWPSIVGDALSARTLPERLAQPPTGGRGRADPAGILHVRVGSGGAAVEMQHQEPVILERIAATLGFRAVARLRLVHAPVSSSPWRMSRTPAAVPRPPLNPDAEARLRSAVADVAAADLRDALVALGRCVLAPSRPAQPEA